MANLTNKVGLLLNQNKPNLFLLFCWIIAIAFPQQSVLATEILHADCGFTRAESFQDLSDRQKAEVAFNLARKCYDFGKKIKSRPFLYNGFYTNQYRQALIYYTHAIDFGLSKSKTYLSHVYMGQIQQDLAWNLRGVEDIALNWYSQALNSYSEAITLIPNLSLAYFHRGELYREASQYNKAIADYTQAIQIDRDLAEAYLGRGTIYEQLGQLQQALDDYQNAVGYKPKDVDVYLARGNIYKKLEKYPQSIADYNRALDLIPDLDRAKYCDFRSDNCDLAIAATDIIPEATDLGHLLAKVYCQRGDVYRSMGEYQKALQDLNESNFIFALSNHCFLIRGEVYRELKQYQQALNDYTTVIRGKNWLGIGNTAQAYLGRGYIYRDRNQRISAIDNFRQAAKIFKQQGNTDLYQTSINEISKLDNKP